MNLLLIPLSITTICLIALTVQNKKHTAKITNLEGKLKSADCSYDIQVARTMTVNNEVAELNRQGTSLKIRSNELSVSLEDVRRELRIACSNTERIQKSHDASLRGYELKRVDQEIKEARLDRTIVSLRRECEEYGSATTKLKRDIIAMREPKSFTPGRVKISTKLPKVILKKDLIATGLRPVEIAKLCGVSEPAVNKWTDIPKLKRSKVMKEIKRRYRLSNKLINSGNK